MSQHEKESIRGYIEQLNKMAESALQERDRARRMFHSAAITAAAFGAYILWRAVEDLAR